MMHGYFDRIVIFLQTLEINRDDVRFGFADILYCVRDRIAPDSFAGRARKR